MKKKIALSGMAVVAVLSLVGCGGGGSVPTSNNTGTAQYVDSAVAGVNFTCGSQTGVTDDKGTFTFEKGKNCKFTLAGITLKDVPSDELVNHGKIVESNITVATFLQSIDKDGNASNGIQIPKEVEKVLKDTKIKVVPQDDNTLKEVCSELQQRDKGFKGHVKTIEEVHHHLEHTITESTKELIAGKTLYTIDEENDGTYTILKLVVNKDATSMVVTELDDNESKTLKIEVIGNNVKGEDGTSHYITKVTNKYIKGHKDNVNKKFILYFNLSDAKKALKDKK